MAKTNLNRALTNIRGRLDGWVYRRTLAGDVSISPIAQRSARPPTQAQLDHREAFRDAASFARSVLGDPTTRPLYEGIARAAKKPAFSLAVGDYFNPPRVSKITLLGYHGQVGDTIKVRADDDIEVMSVTVTLLMPDGTVIESGAATKTSEDWLYTATTAVEVGQSIKVRVVATDRPEHEGTLEQDHLVALPL